MFRFSIYLRYTFQWVWSVYKLKNYMVHSFNQQSINSKEDFLKFLELLIKYFNEHQNEWENITLPDYLDAAQRWTEDMDGYYINNNLPVPQNINWQVFADILIAATMYE